MKPVSQRSPYWAPYILSNFFPIFWPLPNRRFVEVVRRGVFTKDNFSVKAKFSFTSRFLQVWEHHINTRIRRIWSDEGEICTSALSSGPNTIIFPFQLIVEVVQLLGFIFASDCFFLGKWCGLYRILPKNWRNDFVGSQTYPGLLQRQFVLRN